LIGKLYPGVGLPPDEEVQQCIVSTSLVFAVFLTATLLHAPKMGTTIVITIAWLICLGLLPFGRFVTRRVFGNFRWWLQPVVVFGDGPDSRSLLKTLTSRPQLGLSPIGVFDDLHSHWNTDGDYLAEFLGHPDSAPDVSRRRGVYRAIVAMPDRSNSHVHEILAASSDCYPHLLVIQKKRGLPLLWTKGWDVGWHSGVQLTSRLLLPLPRLTKRVVDLALASTAIILLAPLMLLIAAAIKCASRGPVFYGQERAGRLGRPFRAWKFRTMVVDAEDVLTDHLERHPELREEWNQACKLKDDPRIIRWVGYPLRRSSLDELPQLWNVLTGEMSLVGPRPLPQYHLDEFDEAFCRYREKVTPGMTGLWQVMGRNDNRDPKMFVKWDTYYIRNWTLLLDLQILFRTPKTVVKGEGAF
jgi:Undecaprenyl-phosphate galactose phosphotransferase WbaP